MKKSVLIINLGTPDKPTIPSVWRYLRQFLMDSRVIDIPFILRYVLVNFIIIPTRVSSSTGEYRKLWAMYGSSPLMTNLVKLHEKLSARLHGSADVYSAMRYQNPSIDIAMDKIKNGRYDELVILPLYPQYASASTGSTIEYCNNIISQWTTKPKIRIVSDFYNHPSYIECFVGNARKMSYKDYDHILFSYHGLPERHLDKSHIGTEQCSDIRCEDGIGLTNQLCYKAQCYETTRLIADALGMDHDSYSVSFQSRLNDRWVKPYTDVVMLDLIGMGKTKVLVLSPSFISDCLETSVEIGESNREIFIERGGKSFDLVPSLNDDDNWADAVIKILELS